MKQQVSPAVAAVVIVVVVLVALGVWYAVHPKKAAPSGTEMKVPTGPGAVPVKPGAEPVQGMPAGRYGAPGPGAR